MCSSIFSRKCEWNARNVDPRLHVKPSGDGSQNSVPKAAQLHRCALSSSKRVILCTANCLEGKASLLQTPWPTDSGSHPHLACNKLSREALWGERRSPVRERTSYRQHLFGGWCLAAGHDPCALYRGRRNAISHDPLGGWPVQLPVSLLLLFPSNATTVRLVETVPSGRRAQLRLDQPRATHSTLTVGRQQLWICVTENISMNIYSNIDNQAFLIVVWIHYCLKLFNTLASKDAVNWSI